MNMRSFLKYLIIGAVVSLLFFLSMAAPIITSNSDFSIYNNGWNGCSSLAVRTYEAGSFVPNLVLDGGETDVAQRELTSYDVLPSDTSIVIIGPRREFSPGVADHIHNFLMDGGKLILADDFGSGNSLLGELETDSRFSGEPLLDLSFEKKPQFVVAYDISTHNLTEGVDFLMLNHPSTLRPGSDSQVLINSSSASWLDLDDDGIPGPEDPRGGFPILSIESYGDGELVLLSDPSVLINSMIERMDNDRFAENLLDYISQDRNRVIFDESHRDISAAYALVYTIRPPSRHSVMVLIGLTFLLSVMVVFPKSFKAQAKRLFRIFGRSELDEDPLEKVLNENPDWDENKLKMIYERFS